MPTYEYACPKCGHHFEKFQSMNDGRLRKCPKCGKSGLKRLVGGGAGLIFKGSGFYITDYRSENYKAGAKKDAPPAPATASSGESKGASSETKSAAPAKTESKPAKPKKTSD